MHRKTGWMRDRERIHPFNFMPMSSPITPAEEQRYAELQTLALDFARQGNTESLAPMLAAGLPVNLADHKQNTLLMLAAYHGHEETVRMLLKCGAKVDQRNDRQQTPLGGVAFKGYPEIATLLIMAGAEVDADHGNGMTPLMFARMFGREEVAKVLEAAGANSAAKSRGLSIGQMSLLMRFLRILAKPLLWIRSRRVSTS